MPQMAPINWLSLYFMFLIIFILFIIINYFSFIYPMKPFNKNKNKLMLNWKW
uniref:ATP synthase complex subunit 8 n=1 Tax=Aegorhinus superciliosus TaxID=1448030 RepID=A0A0K0K9H6_9CUCU|nr:ATP synthase F0 subunit 8 [Aegorhinus superciliosus]AHG32664.1 ATP synthase F0 subunit 8 [Aegorhinus superciliosus]